jgi:hypothetical protein
MRWPAVFTTGWGLSIVMRSNPPSITQIPTVPGRDFLRELLGPVNMRQLASMRSQRCAKHFMVTLRRYSPCAWGQANSATRERPWNANTFPIQPRQMPKNKNKPATPAALEPVARCSTARRMHTEADNLKSVSDSGTFTTYTATGEKQAYPLTIARKGRRQAATDHQAAWR